MKNLFTWICTATLMMAAYNIQAQNTFPATGNVGIGTTTPDLLLDIESPDDIVRIGIGKATLTSYNSSVGFGDSAMANFGGSGVAIGYKALRDNLVGSNNVAIGSEALRDNKSGSYNISVGASALRSNITGQNNVAIGQNALIANKSGSYNVSIGNDVMLDNKTGEDNTAVGGGALPDNTKGNNNVAIGNSSLPDNTLGNYNVGVGNQALVYNKTGSYNTALGYFTTTSLLTNLENTTALGQLAAVDASNKVVIGNSSVSSIGGQVDWTVYSDARIKEKVEENVPGLTFINRLRPVTYNYNIKTQNQLIGRTDTAQWTDKYAIQEMTFSGFIAQEVAAAAEELGYNFSGVDESGQLMGLRYATFVVPLVKAVQELDAENAIKDTKIESLESRISQLEQLITRQGIVLNNATTEEIYKQSATIENETGVATLSQNVPNPFTGNTSIAYYVPETAQQAHIKIANANGVSLFMAEVRLGNGVLEVDATQLAAGTYSYTLLVDGKVEDTKLMVIL